MIYIISNSKGGVGKTQTSVNLACLLHAQERNFKIIELDNNNDSLIFKNSDFLTTDRAISFKLDKKDSAVSDMLFDVMSDDTLDYIVDIGGGDDEQKVLDVLLPVQLPKTYLIPTLKIKKYLQNALVTYEYINDPENIFFVLNQYNKLENIKTEFRYFFGDKDMGIKPVSPVFKNAKTIYMPYSDLFQIAEDDEQTIYDLAAISKNVTEAEARKMSFDLAAGDREKFGILLTQYNNSLEAQKLFQEMTKSTEALFQE
ncbi:MAG: AAA family ATPase [Sulfurimonas sp.]|nr:AAA family ATPase [Sulfurimonas sp.]